MWHRLPQEQARATSSGESLSLSARAKGLKETEQRLKDHPDVDDSRVEEIRNALQSGAFKVDAQKLAQKMLDMDKSIFG